MDWWQDLLNQNYDWFWDVGIALSLTLILAFVWRLARHKMLALAAKTRNRWDDVVIDAIGVPINWGILAIGATWIADISARHFSSEIVSSIPIGRQLSLLILVAWAIWRLITRVEVRQLDRGADPTTVQMVGKVAKLAVTFLIVLPVFQMLGISISGLLAFGGVGGLVVGMAAKDLLANFFGSIIVYMDRPFKVGDWVRSPDRNIEGTVEHIGFRVTRIRTFDKRPLYVPNAVFTNIVVENPSRMLNRRIYETIGIRYQDARHMQAIIDDVRAMLEQHPDIDQNCIMIVNFNSFAASSLEFFIYTFTKTTAWVEFHAIKQDVMLQVMGTIHAHGADCAFPTRTLHLESMPEGLPAQQSSGLSAPAAPAQS